MTPSIPIIPVGICQCGCGQATTIAKQSHKGSGHVKGEYHRAIRGHRIRDAKRQIQYAVPFRLNGEYCRILHLQGDHFCIVSASDYVYLMQWRWHATKDHNGCWYACRSGTKREGLFDRNVRMHRLLLGLEHGNPLVGDHIDPWNTLNNARHNIRVATLEENARNVRRSPRNTSGYKCVSYDKQRKRYRVRITVGSKKKSFGSYPTAEEAYAVSMRLIAQHHGEFARTN